MTMRRHTLARQAFPAGLRDGVLFVHAYRERLYQISESLPPVGDSRGLTTGLGSPAGTMTGGGLVCKVYTLK